MPKLSLGMTEGTLVEWYVRVGDRVREGMPLAAVETDKLSTEIECPAAGVIVALVVAAGTRAHIGDRLASIADGGDLMAPRAR